MPLSAFHPAVQAWFAERLGTPTAAQARGWAAIRSGGHALIAAPTGSGKTLAAFLFALDRLLRSGAELKDETRALYVSPLKALGNDVRKNLERPLAELRAADPSLPEVRVAVRSGDTPQKERAAAARRPPHVLVTTPESLYILLTSESGRALCSTVRTVIVDEVHALLGDKRGSHLALTLERLCALTGAEPQRIGLSATQKPVADVARFLGGPARAVAIVDEGHLRAIDLAIEIPPSPLEPVCSHETWAEVYARIGALVAAHRSTLVFVSTRKLAERVSARLQTILGADVVLCHHSSLARERRLLAERRLKAGELRALVATASLELGIDVGDVDLVCQVGSTRSIATLLQRVGRSGHGPAASGRVPKGRVFPLTPDELVEAAALARALARGELDRTPVPRAPLDVLAQQVVAACAAETWDEDALFDLVRRSWPYRDLERARFDAVVALHAHGRRALLHRAAVPDEERGAERVRLRGTRRARLTAITCGGAIPDTTQYAVVAEPEGTPVGHVDEDFAVESSGGDVFQLGNASWRVLRIDRGSLRVEDARGAPPTVPFWFGEAPARTRELSLEVGLVRERGVDAGWLVAECGLADDVARELAAYLRAGRDALGATPTPARIVLERFFDESGGMQLVVHAPLGGRINRALGLALRKRFCRRFDFELQAAANEDAVVLSLGPQHAFPLEEVLDWLHPDTVEELLIQALLPTPTFRARWRWNASRSFLVERFRAGGRVPAPLLRMRADDRLAEAFPGAVACPENAPGGDVDVPRDHPIVAQTVEDCLREAMDVDGLKDCLRGLRDGRIARVAVDVPEPTPFARSVLAVRPYGFLDDAPLEERRTQAVIARRALSPRDADAIGQLDAAAVARVRAEAWPDPRDAEELHEALCWIGWIEDAEVAPEWRPWLAELARAGRVARAGERWLAADATRDPQEMLRGRMEALGPVVSDDPLMYALERDGAVLRVRLDGRDAWCDRRLLARIQRYTLERLRREIEPVPTAGFLRFLARWQHVARGSRLEGPAGVARAVAKLAGFEIPARDLERRVLRARVGDYRPEWLDQLALAGEIAWGRLYGSGRSAVRSTPIALFPREEAPLWLGLAQPPDEHDLSAPARAVLAELRAGGPAFARDLARATRMLPTHVEAALSELLGLGHATNDSYASLRSLLTPPSRRRAPAHLPGRWSLLGRGRHAAPEPEDVARALLRRYGVLFRALLARERQPLPWRDLARALRRLELRGEVRGGRFVAGFAGEQFALADAIPALRACRRAAEGDADATDAGAELPLALAPSDPLCVRAALTPGDALAGAAARG